MNGQQQDNLLIAGVITLIVHSVFGGGMYAAGELLDPRAKIQPPIDVEIVAPKPKPKPIEPKPIEPKPIEPKVEEKKPEPPKVEEKKPEKKIRPKVRPKAQPKIRPTVQPQTQDTPAPGENTNDDAPAPVIKMANLGTGTSGPLVARGKPKTRKVGTGGDGTNTGGGGDKASTGTGGPRAVSIAAIKKRAKPLNADLDTSKLYTPEAKRLGIEGQVKVFLVVDNTGKVVRARLTKRLGHGLDKVALKLARKLRFQPAIDTEGRAVADKLEWTFTFVLPQ